MQDYCAATTSKHIHLAYIFIEKHWWSLDSGASTR